MPGLRFHDLRHTCIATLAEPLACDSTFKSTASNVSSKVLEHYSHIRMGAKRPALEPPCATPKVSHDATLKPVTSQEKGIYEAPKTVIS